MCYYSDDIINIYDFNADNILLNEKSYKDFLIHEVAYKIQEGAKPLRTILIKCMSILENVMTLII